MRSARRQSLATLCALIAAVAAGTAYAQQNTSRWDLTGGIDPSQSLLQADFAQPIPPWDGIPMTPTEIAESSTSITHVGPMAREFADKDVLTISATLSPHSPAATIPVRTTDSKAPKELGSWRTVSFPPRDVMLVARNPLEDVEVTLEFESRDGEVYFAGPFPVAGQASPLDARAAPESFVFGRFITYNPYLTSKTPPQPLDLRLRSIRVESVDARRTADRLYWRTWVRMSYAEREGVMQQWKTDPPEAKPTKVRVDIAEIVWEGP